MLHVSPWLWTRFTFKFVAIRSCLAFQAVPRLRYKSSLVTVYFPTDRNVFASTWQNLLYLQRLYWKCHRYLFRYGQDECVFLWTSILLISPTLTVTCWPKGETDNQKVRIQMDRDFRSHCSTYSGSCTGWGMIVIRSITLPTIYTWLQETPRLQLAMNTLWLPLPPLLIGLLFTSR